MQLRLSNLRLPIEAAEAEIPQHLSLKLDVCRDEIQSWRILRKSLDARSRHELQFVYTVAFQLPDSPELAQKIGTRRDVDAFISERFDDPPAGEQPLEHRPVVVGAGPAGLLAGYYLAIRGYRPLIIERGHPVKERVPAIRAFDQDHAPHDPENNYLFGEGGAGCFSDGKLTCRMTGPDVDWVLEALVACGARESIRIEHRPHLGSNKLPLICRNFRRQIEARGGEYWFQCRMESIDVRDGRIVGIGTSGGYIATRHVLLGTGHSARDTYAMLHAAGLPMQSKAFQLGLRIEHPQESVNRWKYGREEYVQLLGAADYSLIAKGHRDLYSFCMCAGGYVIPSVSEPGRFCTNGMSNSRHDTPFANSGLMITLQPSEFGSDHPLAGVELQRRYESVAYEQGLREYLSPIQWANDFLKDRVIVGERNYPGSYQRGTISCDLREVLPPVAIKALQEGLPVLDRRWHGLFLKEATLVGPEMRGSSPLRMNRNKETREVPGIAGLYPVGEGAGYAGGIISAAVDGLRSAREIIRKHAALV